MLDWDGVCSLVRGIDLLAQVAPHDCFEYPGLPALRDGAIQRPYSSPDGSPPPSGSISPVQRQGSEVAPSLL